MYAPMHASDVDVLISHDDPVRLANTLGLELLPTTPPRLYGELDGTPVDITVVNGDDLDARKRRAGPRDAALLVEHVRHRQTVFQQTWPLVKKFVHQRALGHNGLGWFGSFGWAILLAVPLVAKLREVPAGSVFPAWLRWLAELPPNVRITFAGVRTGAMEPVFIEAPAPPVRDVARFTPRGGAHFFLEAKQAALLIGDAQTDADAIARIIDIADAPPPGETLVITFDNAEARGRYDGTARRVLRDLEALGPTRSWGRFDVSGRGWQHRITVATNKAAAARDLVEHYLAISSIDAIVETDE
ncbi:MAG TPA: hypothetical protein VGM39_22500 [Kofleriaceae bacterium]